MKTFTIRIAVVAVVLSCWSDLACANDNAVLTRIPPAETEQVALIDVALSDTGQMAGKLLSAEGTPRGNVAVAVLYNGQEVARTQTDEQGQFGISGLHGGVHTLMTADDDQQTCRLWTKGTAPPAASSEVQLVQHCGRAGARCGCGRAHGPINCCPSCQCQSCPSGRCRAIGKCDGCHGLGLQCVRRGRVLAVGGAALAVIGIASDDDGNGDPEIVAADAPAPAAAAAAMIVPASVGAGQISSIADDDAALATPSGVGI